MDITKDLFEINSFVWYEENINYTNNLTRLFVFSWAKWKMRNIFECVNVEDLTIKELAEKTKKLWYEWEIQRDTSKPNWTKKKLLDVSKLRELWWRYQISLDDGISDMWMCLFNY